MLKAFFVGFCDAEYYYARSGRSKIALATFTLNYLITYDAPISQWVS